MTTTSLAQLLSLAWIGEISVYRTFSRWSLNVWLQDINDCHYGSVPGNIIHPLCLFLYDIDLA